VSTLEKTGEKTGASSFDEWMRRLPETWAYDALFRLIFVAWFLFVEYHTVTGLVGYIGNRGNNPDAVFIANVCARVALMAFLATLMICVILRSRPVGKASGVTPRLTAFLGSYLMLVLPFFPSSEMSLGASIASAALIFLGNGLSVYVLFWLGRSLSIMAEARKLVTTGPYAFVRHPLYVAEELAVLGLFIQYASAWTAVLLAAHVALQIRRMHYEEGVLRDVFPEYDGYAQSTRRLIPGIY
jgi:protein-S-isoprenylcysteine O-methyltransferase Ste14